MIYRVAGCALVLLLGGCEQAAKPMTDAANQIVATNIAEVAPAPADPALATAPLDQWLAGNWSYDTVCGTDLAVHFRPDGTMETAVEQGSWKLAGEALTVTITSSIETDAEGKAAETRVDPPKLRSYTVSRTDAGHGTLTLDGNAIPIQRC
jgi:hypothetical protein